MRSERFPSFFWSKKNLCEILTLPRKPKASLRGYWPKKKKINKNHVEPQLTTFTNSSLCDVRVGSYFRQQSCQNKKTSDSLEVSQVWTRVGKWFHCSGAIMFVSVLLRRRQFFQGAKVPYHRRYTAFQFMTWTYIRWCSGFTNSPHGINFTSVGKQVPCDASRGPRFQEAEKFPAKVWWCSGASCTLRKSREARQLQGHDRLKSSKFLSGKEIRFLWRTEQNSHKFGRQLANWRQETLYFSSVLFNRVWNL